ncbi:MAG: TRAP transporter substrate-binding protein [Rhodospirillales bacterium]|nr:TRAP transporter substrate-binding protein [Rhodospirillales bacterium]MCW8862461.1 TRAP transporter substrate-binding protein [Rhodospirillales bacterium]MCW8952514.1 TRAP transporter substrate-binding protein [Rhodospirillales bacterium]MCW8970034.1 TRAP transporter substrate-binding protein [Rhodospirillales bacterium]MCW9001924.1 TRAP transporter substrate-binding protein [Rhodospirillales bacterium]
MKRREFIKGAALTGVATAAAASSLAKPAIAQGKRELKMVTTWPKNFPGLGTGAQRFADRVTNATDGRLTVKLYAAGELVPPFESFSAVSSGTADMYHGADYYWQGKSKAYNFFTAVPYGLTANENDAWLMHGGGQELWDELGAGFGIKHLPAGNTGVQMGGWFNKEINSLEDFKGLKIRMPGLGGEVLRRIGAAAVTLPGGEIFPALQSGAIDATEWVGPWNDLAFGFYKVTKYYYWPGFHEPGSTLSVGINKGVWDGFSKSDQDLVTSCAYAENNYMYAEFNARNGDALDTLRNKHGVVLKQFPDEVMKAIGDASGVVMSEVAKTDEITGKVYKSFIDFRKKALGWTSYAERAYMQARLLPFKYSD